MRGKLANALKTVILAVAGLGVTACPDVVVPIVTGERTIYVDVRNAMFDAPDPDNPTGQGVGATELTLSVVTDPAAPDGAWTATLAAADLDLDPASIGYTRVPIDVEGTLLRVEVEVATPAGTLSETLSDYPGEGIYQGWVAFANVLKYRLGYTVADPVEESTLWLSVAPRGGSDVALCADTGPAGTDTNRGLTDRSADLESGEVAVQVALDENPVDVTLAVYTAVVDLDIAALYDPAVSFEGTYVSDPWSPAWSYTQIAGEGRSVGGVLYTLESYREVPFDADDPHGDGKHALLITAGSGGDPDLLEKYLLVAIVVTASGLSVPLDVLCLDIE